MILELATLTVRPGQEAEFEAAFPAALPLLAATPGYRRAELRRCIEMPNRYVLLVVWDVLEAHTIGFRQGPNYPEWRRRLHPFYEPAPTVEHYGEPLFPL
jgi:heme-degrading monooxygenase HmoA